MALTLTGTVILFQLASINFRNQSSLMSAV